VIISLSYEKKKKPELIAEINEYKNREMELKTELQRLQTESNFMQESRENLENEKKNLTEKLETKETKIEELVQDKEILLKEKAVIAESKNDILEQVKEKELLLQQNDQKITELREKFKKSSSDLLSKSMQIDKLVKKDKNLGELEETIQNLKNMIGEQDISEREKVTKVEERIRSLEIELETSQNVIKELKEVKGEKPEIIEETIEGTKIISNLNNIFEIIKDLLPQGKSNIRLVVPEIDYISKFELINTIKEIPTKVRINIGAKIEDPAGNICVQDLKNHCQLTNYSAKKFIALNVDSSKFLIGLFIGENEVLGIYTEVLEIINLFKPAIMEPFIRGVKIN